MTTYKTALAALLTGIALAVSGCGSSGAAFANTADTPAPTPKTNLPAKWCKAQPGMTRAQLRAVMGAPSRATGPKSAVPRMEWASGHYLFVANVDETNRSYLLHADTSRLTKAEKARIRCEEDRLVKISTGCAAWFNMPDRQPHTYVPACSGLRHDGKVSK